MAFKKSSKVKAAAPVVVDRRGGEDKDAIIARQAAALERAWKERDAARDELVTYKNRVGKLDAEIATLKEELKSARAERNRLDDRVSELMAERTK